MVSEKQFYNSVNPKLIEDLNATIDELKEDEKNANKNRRNKAMSRHTVGKLLNPISRNQITRELEIAGSEDNLNNSVEDMEYEHQRDMNEEEQEKYCEKCEDEFWKWGEEPEASEEDFDNKNLPE